MTSLRHKMQSEVSDTFTAFNEVLELAEIVAVLRTAYRVFFENSQMFGAERWNAWKFVVSKRRNAGTSGNLFTAFDNALERAEICSQRSTGHWNLRKFIHSKQQDAGTCGNLFTASDKVLEPAEIVAVLRTAYRVFFENSQMFGAACRNERKLSQRGALLTSQIKDLLIEFLLYKQPPQGTARKNRIGD